MTENTDKWRKTQVDKYVHGLANPAWDRGRLKNRTDLEHYYSPQEIESIDKWWICTYVATLPCDLSLIDCFQILMFHSSVETCARCGGILNNHFTANILQNLTVKEFWKSVQMCLVSAMWQNIMVMSLMCSFRPTLYKTYLTKPSPTLTLVQVVFMSDMSWRARRSINVPATITDKAFSAAVSSV